MWPRGSGEIQTFSQAGGILSARMRRSVSPSVISAPDGPSYRKPPSARARVIPGACGSLRTSPGTAAAGLSSLMSAEDMCRPPPADRQT